MLIGPRLQQGDRVRFVSPASTPDREKVDYGARLLTSWGLRVEIGVHVFDRLNLSSALVTLPFFISHFGGIARWQDSMVLTWVGTVSTTEPPLLINYAEL